MSFALEKEVRIIRVETHWNLVYLVGIEAVNHYEKVECQHWKIANTSK
jgi:hypothetical protein